MKYTKEFLTPFVKESNSMRELILKLKLQYTGGNITHIKRCIQRENIDFSHFQGQSWRKGKTFPKKYKIEDYLSNKRIINSNALKQRLFDENIFEKECQGCFLTKWMDNPIGLELHHIDNNHSNNNLSNLNILCPNCHWELDNGLLVLPLSD